VIGHIGIVACSAEGAALCYRTIAAEGATILGDHDHPRVTLDSIPMARHMEAIRAGDWAAVGELMLVSAGTLKGAGADFLICPDNTIHQALPFIRDRSPLPWLHIAEVVAAEAGRRGFRRLGVTGTKYLVESEVYPEALAARGIDFVRTPEGAREDLNRIIFDELVYGDFRPDSVAAFRRTIERLRDEGCDAVVLGCTEIPLIISDANSALPTLDSTRLLARAALKRASSGGPGPRPSTGSG